MTYEELKEGVRVRAINGLAERVIARVDTHQVLLMMANHVTYPLSVDSVLECYEVMPDES